MSQFLYFMPRFQKLFLILGCVALMGVAFDAIFLRNNDFAWHYQAGMHFLEGHPFDPPAEWYPLARIQFDVLLRFLPYRISRAVVFVLALIGLLWSLQKWETMLGRGTLLPSRLRLAVVITTILVLIPYLHRDFQECGLQAILLTVLTAGIYALWSGQSLRAGWWFGLAAAMKTTPLLCLPVLVWKRRWLSAIVMVVAFVGWNLLPALYLGLPKTIECHQRAWAFVQRVGSIKDIAENGVEPPNPKNQALMSLFARYLQSYPKGHNLCLSHPLFVQPFNLDTDSARHIAKAAVLLLAAWIAWRLWGKWDVRDESLPGQFAVVCIFCALMSPLCWRQHLVLAVPAAYLVIRDAMTRERVGVMHRSVLIFAALLIWLPQRELMGLQLSMLLMASKLDTMLLLVASLTILHMPVNSRNEQGLSVRCFPVEDSLRAA
jgi:hypothetical protein